MKRLLIYASILIPVILLSGCKSYLDRQTDTGFDESDLYRDYESAINYLDRCILELEHTFQRDHMHNGLQHNSNISDECATTGNNPATGEMNNGNWLKPRRSSAYEIGVNDRTSIARSYRSLRVANRIIAHYDEIENITEAEYKELVGQAHFFRAWYYFELLKRYGGMPIFDKVFVGNGDEDLPRQTYQGSHDWMTEDIEIAISNLPDSWDDANIGRPTKLAAMALRSMTELYAASPLMQNDLNSNQVLPYNKDRAKKAAQLADKAIKYVDASSDYRLVSKEEYKNIFYFETPPFSHPEHIWYNRRNTGAVQEQIRIFCIATVNAGVTGSFAATILSPTLNIINMHDKKGADGIYYPIDDPRSGYSIEDKPFENRDPRFHNNILLPGERFGKKANGTDYVQSLFIGGTEYNRISTGPHTGGRQISGFMHKKFNWPDANQWANEWGKYRFGTTVFIRVAQLYLDFAEASFEATGSATAVVEGCSMSAEDAINVIRLRAGSTALPSDIVADAKKFREAYRRERAVELFLENHRWWDIRRWMIAHELFKETSPIKGVKAYLQNDHQIPQIENGRVDAILRYEEFDMNIEMRTFGMRNYWYPFPVIDVTSLKNLQQNPGW